MKNIITSLDTINTLQKKVARRGINYSLDRLSKALEQLGNPHLFFKDVDVALDPINMWKAKPLVVHVAGTNGKGSVCHYITQGLIKLKQRVLTYTSPHIHTYNERFCLNGEPISDECFNELFNAVNMADVDDLLSEYEVLTLMAFVAVQQLNPDVFVMETGLGGRLDATNVVPNSLVIITDIDMDHQDILGNTLTDIATEKSGIIKPGALVVTHSDHHPDVQQVISETVKHQGAKLKTVQKFNTCDDRNKALAIQALELLVENLMTEDRGSGELDFTSQNLVQNVVVWLKNECGPPFGRLSQIQLSGVNCWMDVGHNLAAAKAVLVQLNKRFHWVLGMQAKKNPVDVIRWLLSNGQTVSMCEFDDSICLRLEDLPGDLQNKVSLWKLGDTVSEGTVFFGSFYFVEYFNPHYSIALRTDFI